MLDHLQVVVQSLLCVNWRLRVVQIFRNNDRANPSDYEGPREADGIVGRAVS